MSVDGSKLLSGVRAGRLVVVVSLCASLLAQKQCVCLCGTSVSDVSVFGVDIWLVVQKFI